METWQNFIIVGILVTLTVIFFKWKSKREKFYRLNESHAEDMLRILNEAIYDILDNKKWTFVGELETLNRRHLYDEFTMEEGYSSFTENKKRIVLCLRDKNNNIYPFNSLIYVLLHEVAHVINREIHHTKKFQKIFNELLIHSERLGYYNPKLPFESNYCSG